jgi:LysR family nitrogen assimilation transcriptional regulator
LFLLSKLQENDAESTTIGYEQASTIGLVLPGQANLTRQLIDDAFNAEGYKLNIVAEIDSLSTIQSIVESGYASTILSKSAMVSKNKDTSIRARSIEGRGLKRRLSLCISDIFGYGTAAECVAALIPELVNSCILSGNWSGATSLQPPRIDSMADKP